MSRERAGSSAGKWLAAAILAAGTIAALAEWKVRSSAPPDPFIPATAPVLQGS